MSGLPYKFEPGMRVDVHGSALLVVEFGGEEPAVLLYCPNGDYTDWHHPEDCMADLDHPGTRGLLLQQYRDASWNQHAVTIEWSANEWLVVDGLHAILDGLDKTEPANLGAGESEGAAILDALTRLAAERARESEPCLRIDESVFQQRVLARLDSIEQRLRAMEVKQ